jgi:hypothetical protein
MFRPILVATLIAGTLDIISAFVFSAMAGVSALAVLKFVASGPFGDSPTETLGWGLVGLTVHFAIMACMVAAYMFVAPRLPILLRHPIAAGILYGILLWIIMYWIVRPLRFPELPLPHTLKGISQALFSHCLLVGIPIALVATRFFRNEKHLSGGAR